jgi:hypothetical protein
MHKTTEVAGLASSRSAAQKEMIMAQFVLMLRDNGRFFEGMSPEEIQAVIGRYRGWSDKLRASGTMVGGQKLAGGEGRVMVRNGGGVAVTDGPFTEAKEILGGFFHIKAADYDEAQAIAGDCPHLDFGTVEIRRVDVMAD